ncbi:MAG TPA: GNAT family N-acetyltransferase, partial [Acidobacteriota bacterium]|nr:GNAT family N-acetyltransferase [Acidobacteriota bacterium]
MISRVKTLKEAQDLDQLFWKVLWEPFGLPVSIRESFKVDGEEIELIAKNAVDKIVGGLVAFRTGEDEIEIRHLAVHPKTWRQGVGRKLVDAVYDIAAENNCRRIHTISRNTSSGFFRKTGFTTAPGIPP